MLGTFFQENIRKTFVFVNYTIIAKEIEDKEEAKKKKLEESKKKLQMKKQKKRINQKKLKQLEI